MSQPCSNAHTMWLGATLSTPIMEKSHGNNPHF
ncbi:hypothetical protein 20Sep420_00012 [Pseudomonas phage 20Sep420]|nr:hypothetical protein 20Sep420_00012 [Pseudomonas phage 20Sep420]